MRTDTGHTIPRSCITEQLCRLFQFTLTDPGTLGHVVRGVSLHRFSKLFEAGGVFRHKRLIHSPVFYDQVQQPSKYGWIFAGNDL